MKSLILLSVTNGAPHAKIHSHFGPQKGTFPALFQAGDKRP
jgi:hypothetical protein